MEQNQTKRAKRTLYSVYVFVKRDIQEGRSMARRKRLNQPRVTDQYLSGDETTEIKKFLYLNVTKIRKTSRLGYLCIQIGIGKNKELHYHDMRRIESLQIREHDRSGRIQ